MFFKNKGTDIGKLSKKREGRTLNFNQEKSPHGPHRDVSLRTTHVRLPTYLAPRSFSTNEPSMSGKYLSLEVVIEGYVVLRGTTSLEGGC